MKIVQKGSAALVLVVIMVFAIVAGGAYYYRSMTSRNTDSDANNENPPLSNDKIEWDMYTNTEQGFEVEHLAEMPPQEVDSYGSLGKGISFVFAPSLSEGTNLSDDSRVHIEVKKGAVRCSPQDFLENPGSQTAVSKNGVEYKKASSVGAAAGNLYEETIYVASANEACYGIRLFIHSGNIGNYEPGSVEEFDKDELVSVYEEMMDTFKILGSSAESGFSD